MLSGCLKRFRRKSLRFEDHVLSSLVLVRLQVQPPGALLELVEAPGDLGEVSLRVRLEDAKRAYKSRNLDLVEKLFEAAREHSFARALTKA